MTLKRLAYPIAEAAAAAGISRSQIYNLVRNRDLPAHKIGRRTLVLAANLEHWLASLPTFGSQSGDPAASDATGGGQADVQPARE